MNLIEKATIMHYHRHRTAQFQHGAAESLGWRSRLSQQTRYQVLIGVGDLNGASVLDAGCGYGDLKAFLDERFSGFTYLGIDQMPEFIEEARGRYADCARTVFFQADFGTVELPRVDYVFASGALGYRCNNPDFYTGVIGKLYACAQKALSFNMLDKKHFPRHDLLVGHDRDEIVAYCRTLSHRVQCVDGYLEDDFTVFVYR